MQFTKWTGRGILLLVLMFISTNVSASTVYWTDWTEASSLAGNTWLGTITTPTATVDITYNNPQGIGFFQASGGIDYWQNGHSGRNPATSPYTSDKVDNIPTGTDIVALQHAGSQTLTFSEAIANPVFSYVSLNGNGYAFDQDFEILSFGHSSDGNDNGYWGSGTSYKNIVDLGGGNFEYQLLGTGEPHGTLRFTGTFDTVTWTSLSNEYWNGFTVGIEGTESEIFPGVPEIPEPATMLLFGLGLLGLAGVSREKT
ncbi:MAG: PEP-CTERM sorting domain-containing protein [Bacteroidota bacterium]